MIYKKNITKLIKNKILEYSRKIIFLIILLVNFIWIFPLVIIIRLLGQFIVVKMGHIRSERVGHFCIEATTQIILDQNNLSKNYIKGQLINDSANQIVISKNKTYNIINLFWFEGRISNKYFAHKIKKKIKIYWWVKYLHTLNKLFSGWQKHYIPEANSRDTEGLFHKYNFTFSFTKNEEDIAIKWLNKMGWTKGEPFICLFVRDSEYLNNRYKTHNWDYHSFRDSDIDTYIPSIEWLTNQGVWVVRLGQKMKKPIPIKNKRIIDYSFIENKHDFLDFWFFANCAGCISTASGLDILAILYKKPNLFVNAMPLPSASTFQECIWVPKNMKWKKTNTPLTLNEYLKHHYFRSECYEEKGILIEDLNSEEILLAVIEFWSRIKDNWKESESNMVLHQNFMNKFENWEGFSKFHKWIHPKFRIGSTWLKERNKNFF